MAVPSPLRPAVPGPNRSVGLTLLALLAVVVAGYAFVVYTPSLLGGSTAGPPELPNVTRAPTVLAVHAITGALALLIGALQLWTLRRGPAGRWHRRLGGVYVISVAVSGAAGLLLAPGAAGGPWGRSGFALLAVLWLGTTAWGTRQIGRGARDAHRRAMVRSFALSCAAISLRLQLPLALFLGAEFATAYAWIAWTCWVPNLIVSEVWLRRR